MNWVKELNEKAAEPKQQSWLTVGRFAAFFALVLVASYPDVLVLGRTFFFRDFGIFGYPLAYYQKVCLWQGQMPLWNPYNDCGLPHLAQWNTMCLYPLSFIYLLQPLEWGLSFFCLFHLWLAGVGMFVFVRYFLAGGPGLARDLAAGVAAMALAGNGLALNCLMWPNNVAALGLMPWVIWLVMRGWREGGRMLACGALAGAAQMLAGAPEFILFTWVIIGVLWGADLLGAKEGRMKLAWRLGACGILVAGLAMAQLLPFLELLHHSQRSETYAGDTWALPPWGWANLLVPVFYTMKWNFGVMLQHEQYWTASYYPGMAVVALAALGCWVARGYAVRGLGILALVVLVLALGESGGLYPLLRKAAPITGFCRFPAKFVIPLVFIFPLLAAQGVHGWLAAEPRWKAVANRFLVVGGLILAATAGICEFDWRNPFGSEFCLGNAAVRVGFFAAVSVLLLVARWTTEPTKAALLALVLPGLIWLDGRTHAPNQNPTGQRWMYEAGATRPPEAPTLGTGRVMSRSDFAFQFHESFRQDAEKDVMAKRLGYFGDLNLLDEVPKLNGMYSLHTKETSDFLVMLYAEPKILTPAMADFLGVTMWPTPSKHLELTPRTNSLPLVTMGQRPLCVDKAGAFMRMCAPTNFEPWREVVLPEEARGKVPAASEPTAKVAQVKFGANEVSFVSSASNAAVAVIAQSYYPAWKAYVDGAATELWPADYAFQAVAVPAGRHEVKLVYEDRAFRLGAVISLLALGCVALIFWRAGQTKSVCQPEAGPA